MRRAGADGSRRAGSAESIDRLAGSARAADPRTESSHDHYLSWQVRQSPDGADAFRIATRNR